MATETLNINAIDSAFSDPNGAVTDIDEAVASADGNSYGTTTENDTADFGLTPTALTDGDTINSVTITVRAQKGGTAGNERFQVDLLIGGVVQGSQQSTGNLTTSFANYTGINDAGWNSDWTQAQLNGMQVRLTAIQAGMGGTQITDLDCIDVIIDYTGGVTHTATVAQTMPTPSQSATGAHVQEHTATVAQTMPTPSQAATGTSIQNFAYFDGTNDYFTALDVSGAAQSSKFTLNFWVKPDADAVLNDYIISWESNRFHVYLTDASGGKCRVEIDSRNGGGTREFRARSNQVINLGQANHIAISVDLVPGTPVVDFYINKVANEDTGYVNRVATTGGAIDWNAAGGQTAELGRVFGGSNLLKGGIQEVFLEIVTYTDLSTDLSDFITADDKPEILGIDGSIPTGTQPAIYCHNPYDSFEVNSGSLGDFTVNGALTDEGTLPQLTQTHTATVAQTIPTPTQSATSEHPFIASAAQTAPTPSQAATGAEEFQAAAAQTAPTPSQAATGEHSQDHTATVAQTAPTPSQTATGEETFSAAVSQVAPTPSQDATGILNPDASVAQTAPTPTQSATGTHAPANMTAAAAQTMPTPLQSATASEIFVGTAAQTMPTPSQLATGIHTAAAVGPPAGSLSLMGVGI